MDPGRRTRGRDAGRIAFCLWRSQASFRSLGCHGQQCRRSRGSAVRYRLTGGWPASSQGDRPSSPISFRHCVICPICFSADSVAITKPPGANQLAAKSSQRRCRTAGVYWIAVYDILEAAGLDVYLVNARDTKNLPGRKSDVQESQWLMKLHTCGRLRNSFRPSQEIRTMRTYWRQRNDLVQAAASYIQRMQKVLTQMNIQLANVLSDISGVTGQAIIKAILAGQRDAHKLAELRDPRVRASEEQIARYLEGNWQEDLLFVLKQEQQGYEFCQQQMAACDRQLEQYLQQSEDRSQGTRLPEEMRKGRLQKKKGNRPQFDLRAELFRMTGTDLTQIDGLDVMTATTIVSEAGWDMSKWADEDHFVSWLRLCPDNRISGNKVIGKGRLPTNNRASIALRMAASTLRMSNTYLGAQFRRFRTKLGSPIAIKAMAAKLARLVYRMLRYGMKYVDQGAQLYETKHRKQQVIHLKRKAAQLGLQIIEVAAAA